MNTLERVSIYSSYTKHMLTTRLYYSYDAYPVRQVCRRNCSRTKCHQTVDPHQGLAAGMSPAVVLPVASSTSGVPQWNGLRELSICSTYEIAVVNICLGKTMLNSPPILATVSTGSLFLAPLALVNVLAV